MNNKANLINSYGWADWSLDNISIDFDEIKIILSCDAENKACILCKDYIGISLIGQWDENIIEEISVEDTGNLIDDSINMVKEKYSDSDIPFCSKHLDDNWMQLNIKLIDGIVVSVACKDLELNH